VTLYLVRHGETEANRDGLGLGRGDSPLTTVGVRQAEALALALSGLPVAAVWSSPLRRARHTAEAIARTVGAEVEVVEALAELDVGETEGLPYAEIRRRWPTFIAAWLGPNPAAVRMPGGESLEDLATRIRPLLPRIRELEPSGLAIVSHTFVIRVLACLLLDLPVAAFRSFACDLASVAVLDLAPRPVVRRWNDTCHLRRLEPGDAPAYGGEPR